jgi:hypothetical protein
MTGRKLMVLLLFFAAAVIMIFFLRSRALYIVSAR